MGTRTDTDALEVPYVDLSAQHREIKEQLLAAVGRVLDQGDFVLGEDVEEFERRFARLCGVAHAVGLNSGTDALMLALRALGIGTGDEVIVPANSFVSSASAVMLAGAHPVLVDVGTDYNVDPDAVAAAVTERTRAIMPVHLTGRPAAMDALTRVAARHDLVVVEDAAQAVLARYGDRPVGSLGTVGCFSLHPLKTLNACGDGGIAVTDDDEVAERLRALRNIGQQERGIALEWSGNSRLDTVQAAMLLVKLEYTRAWTERRRANAAFYQEALAGLPGIDVPHDEPWEWAVYHTFVIQSDDRDSLKRHLAGRGVKTGVHYPVPIHLQPAAAALGYRRGDLPVAEYQADRILSLPVHPTLSREQLEHVSASIRSFVEQTSR